MSEVAFASLPVFAPVVESSSLATMQPTAGVLIWRCRYCIKTWQEAFGDKPYESRKKFCSNRCCRDSEYARNKGLIRARAYSAYYKDIGITHEKDRERYIKHRKKISARRKLARGTKAESGYENRRAKFKRDYHLLKHRAYAKLGDKCNVCGELRVPTLSVDHVNGDGAAHRKTATGLKFYRDVISDDDGRFQLLCMNCQWMKRHINGETKKPRLLLGAAVI